MPAFRPDVVDLVGASADDVTELFIVKDSPWEASDDELSTFQAKVQTYVSFVLDGPMAAQFPDRVGKPWRIVVDSQVNEPDERTAFVLQALPERLAPYGGTIVVTSRGVTP